MRVEPSAVAAPLEISTAHTRKRSVTSFLEKYYLLLSLVFVAIACIRIVSTYNALSLTIDEPVHLAAGIEYLANHAYSVDAEHPPLSRAVEAIGPYLAGARPHGFTEAHDQGNAIIAHTGHVDRTVFLMRLGNLPFSCWHVEWCSSGRDMRSARLRLCWLPFCSRCCRPSSLTPDSQPPIWR